MLRRILTLAFLVVVGSALPVTGAAALPISSPYPAPVVPTVSAGAESVEPGGFVTMSGSGFLPGEPIDITVEYSLPSGLRRNAALIELAAAAAAAGARVETVADASGAFVAPVQMEQMGIATITATGRISGFSITQVVRVGLDSNGNPVLPGGAPVAPAPGSGGGGVGGGTGETAVAAPAPGEAGSGGSDGGAVAGAGSDSAGSATGSEPLASTGASVVGPLAVGAALLAAGLLMLFFGTRLVIRRRVPTV